MNGPIYDAYDLPAGAQLAPIVERARRAFRERHECEPAAVWLNPELPDVALDLPVMRSRHMSRLMVYLEVPGEVEAAPAPVQMRLW